MLKKTLVLGLGLGGLVACATSRPIDNQASDAVITSTIETKLAADVDTDSYEIDVDTLNGVVRLRGIVETERSERKRSVSPRTRTA